MKKNLLKSAIVLIAIAGLLALAGCDTAVDDPENLGTPANVAITVEERTMTVTWDEVSGASGYEIITDSVGCGSGKRKINTKDITAIVYNTDNNPPEGNNAMNTVKADGTQANGSVLILAKNKIQITLMPQMMGDQNVPMATEVSAKVKALGDGTQYLDSVYSAVKTYTLSSGGMGGM